MELLEVLEIRGKHEKNVITGDWNDHVDNRLQKKDKIEMGVKFYTKNKLLIGNTLWDQ